MSCFVFEVFLFIEEILHYCVTVIKGYPLCHINYLDRSCYAYKVEAFNLILLGRTGEKECDEEIWNIFQYTLLEHVMGALTPVPGFYSNHTQLSWYILSVFKHQIHFLISSLNF